MTQDLSEEELYEEAKKRVKDRRRFYNHLGAYLVVNTILVIIWAISGGPTDEWSGYGTWTGNKWFLWPLVIWGFFVILDFLRTFVFRTNAWREKADIDKEVEKIKKERQGS